MKKTLSVFRLVLFAAVLLLAGCATKKEVADRILWPPPPSDPRMEWIGNYYSEYSFPKTRGEKISEAILGTKGLSPFKTPFDIAVDGKGKVYVSDVHDKNVKVWDMDAQKIQFLTKLPMFATPAGLELDSAGNLYVADADKKVVMIFSPQGEYLRAFGEEVFDRPVYMDINERLGRIYVSDGVGHHIHVFDMEGKHLFTFGEKGASGAGLYTPQGIAIDDQDRVYVADMFNARIQIFDADGNYLRSFGERGDQTSQFEFPKDLAFDREGNLWITDVKKSMLMTFTPEGEFLLATGVGASSGHALGFSTPTGLWIDDKQRIYIADGVNRRFTIWQYLTESYLKEHPISEEELRLIRRRMQREETEE